MRSLVLFLVALFAGVAPAQGKAISSATAADAVVAAVRANDTAALAALATAKAPDPWRVADELSTRGAHDAAAAFAKAASGPAVAALAAYVEGRRGAAPDTAAREAFEAMGPAHAAGDFEKVVSLSRTVEAKATVAGVLVMLARADALERLRKPREASVEYERAGAAAREIGWLVHADNGYALAGVMAAHDNQPQRAHDMWKVQVVVARALGDHVKALASELQVATVLAQLGRLPEALAAVRAVRREAEERGHRSVVADALNRIGEFERGLGRLGPALAALEDARSLYEELERPRDVAKVATGMGATYLAIGEYEKAVATLEPALPVHRASGARLLEMATLGNLAVAHLRLQDHERALARFEELLPRQRAFGPRARADVAKTLTNIGAVCFTLDRTDRAIAVLTEALAIKSALGDMAGTVSTLTNLGYAHAKRGDDATAALVFEKALPLIEDNPHPDHEARLLLGLARLRLRQGNAKRAAALARRGVEVAARLSIALAAGEAARKSDEYEGLFATGASAAAALGDVAGLFWFLERGRASSLRASLGSRDAIEAATVPAPLRAALDEARVREKRAFDTMQRAGRSRARIRAARRAWNEARDVTETVVNRIEREAKAAAAITLDDADPLPEVAERLAPFEALLLFGVTETGTHMALVVRRDANRIVDLGPSPAILAAIDAVSAGRRGIEPAAVPALARRVAAPLALEDDVTRVLVSPVGELGSVPFGLLFPRREVVHVPSGTTLGLLLDARGERGRRVLAFGDPVYAGRLPQLPGTRAEVEAIADVAVLGAAATETGIQAHVDRASRWRAVHFACHGLVDPARGVRSSLALTGDDTNDGNLTCLELLRLRVPADLVVLSACETATGRVTRTEGVVGLARTFMFAGAPRVICSLWKVDDEATRALMAEFYELWNPGDGRAGLPTATALKRAQELVRGHDAWAHPRYWAAWQLWGLGN